jgi:hypothetical protein
VENQNYLFRHREQKANTLITIHRRRSTMGGRSISSLAPGHPDYFGQQCYIAMYVQFANVWWLWLLLPIQFLMSPIHGAIINWFAHKYGYRNFEVGDTSRIFCQ